MTKLPTLSETMKLVLPAMRRLPKLSDGKRRYVTAKEHARLSAMAKAANKPLREFLELGGHLEGKLK